MTAYQHILVGTDFSPASGVALKRALSLARRDDARLTVVHISGTFIPEHSWPSIWTMSPEEAQQALTSSLRLELDDFVAGYLDGDKRDLDLTLDVVPGEPRRALNAYAVERGCDLVVVSATGRSGLGRLLVGSTTEAVVRQSTVPVWVERGDGKAGVRRILVGVDNTTASDNALSVAMGEREREGAELHVVHACTDSESRVFSLASESEFRRYREGIMAAERDAFSAYCNERLPASLVLQQVVTTHLIPGAPWRALVRHATDFHIDLVVVGCKPHGLVYEMFIGSTGERLLRHAPSSVLVVR